MIHFYSIRSGLLILIILLINVSLHAQTKTIALHNKTSSGSVVKKRVSNKAIRTERTDSLTVTKPLKTKTESPGTFEFTDSLINYAKTLIGIPYVYASTNPLVGFDCSGFITHVFAHFNVSVPRSSVDFTNYGREVSRANAKPGDLILFTGTDSTIRVVGHMGIVILNQPDKLQFIHSSSGKANGVVITDLNKYYMGRFVKLIRVFNVLDTLD